MRFFFVLSSCATNTFNRMADCAKQARPAVKERTKTSEDRENRKKRAKAKQPAKSMRKTQSSHVGLFAAQSRDGSEGPADYPSRVGQPAITSDLFDLMKEANWMMIRTMTTTTLAPETAQKTSLKVMIRDWLMPKTLKNNS